MKKAHKEKLIHYIANKSYRGASIADALKYYAEDMAESASERAEIRKVVSEIQKGQKTEDVLIKNKIINAFQYAILKASARQRDAYALLPAISKNEKNNIGAFYLKTTLFPVLILSSTFYYLPEVGDVLQPFIDAKMEQSDFMGGIDPIRMPWIFQNETITTLIADSIVVSYISAIIFFIWSYRARLDLHYKVFKARAFKDSLIYLSLLKNMVKNGVMSYKAFEILGKYSEPSSSRKFFSSIAQKIKQGGRDHFFKKELSSLGIDGFTQYEFKVAYNSGEYEEAIENAYVSALDYVEVEEPKHKALVKDTVDITMILVGVYVLVEFVLLTGKIY